MAKMVAPSPWLAIDHTKTSTSIREYEHCWGPDTSESMLIGLVGRQKKSEILRQLLHVQDDQLPCDPHGQIFIWPDPSAPEILYADCELHGTVCSSAPAGIGAVTTRVADWHGHSGGPFTRRRVANLLTGRVVGSLCNVICYFSSDLGGLRAVAALLAAQISERPPTDQPIECLPVVLVVVESSSQHFDEPTCKASILEMVFDMVRMKNETDSDFTISCRMERHFREVHILGFATKSISKQRSRQFRRRVLILSNESRAARRKQQWQFSRKHTQAFASELLDHFCSDYDLLFSFVLSSHPVQLNTRDFQAHVEELWSLLPSEAWIWHLFCPLIALAIILASYPPGAHHFPIIEVYHTIFRSSCTMIVYHSKVQQETRDDIFKALERLLVDEYTKFISSQQDVKDFQRSRLIDLQPYLASLRSNKTCLCCLMEAPEKVLACGHALGDTCIRRFGVRSRDSKYNFVVANCPLCQQYHCSTPFELVPPTAGIRLLSIDGGGIRGVIPLEILRQVEGFFASLSVPLSSLFDFVCGSSAGGLVAIGLFLMGWDCEECLQKFDRLAVETFKQEGCRFTAVRVLLKLIRSYLCDAQYSSSTIEKAFTSNLGEEIRMFNPLSNDTKVAVTTTTAKDPLPYLLTNYNGGVRPKGLGYGIVRAGKSQHDVVVSHAASCTSAAPWFFKPKAIDHIGTFQDGGLQHNNPLNVALWEMKFIWPRKTNPDFVLSLGTGCTDTVTSDFAITPQSPVHDRFVLRIFKTFMRSMDGEKIWQEFLNGVEDGRKHRFHRINLKMKGPEPGIDDVNAMEQLRRQATLHARTDSIIQPVLDSILASLFYFEFEDIPKCEDSSYACVGHVFCRLSLPTASRKLLYQRLRASSSHFLVMGTPVVCVERISSGVPLFRRRVSFQLQSLDDQVGITLRGITSASHTISGLPRTANELIELQGLRAPFGGVDCLLSKPLPKVPAKRKFMS